MVGIDLDSDGARPVLKEALQARVRAADARLARDQGDLIETPEPQAIPDAQPATAKMLGDLAPEWTGFKARPRKGVDKMRFVVAEFDRYTDRTPLQGWTKEHGLRYRTKLTASDLADSWEW